MSAKKIGACCGALGLVLFLGASPAAEKKPSAKSDAASAQRETVAKPLSEKEQRRRAEKLRKELETPYRKWLNEDVSYIITDEERAAFKRLSTDEEREQFIEQFWLRRDPTPDTRRERVQGRALPPHRLRQRALRLRHPRLEDGPRTHLHHLRPGRRSRIPSLRRQLRAAHRGRRRHHLHLPLREVALPVHRGHRHRHHHRVRRSHHDRRVPHDHGPLRKGRPPHGPQRRPHPVRADGPGFQGGPLQPHRRHPPGRRRPASARAHEPVRAPGAVRQAAEDRPPSSSRTWRPSVTSRITFNLLPLKVRADFIKLTESTVMTNITVQLREQGPPVPAERRPLQGHGEHVRAHHLHVSPRGERLRRACGDRNACRVSRGHLQALLPLPAAASPWRPPPTA